MNILKTFVGTALIAVLSLSADAALAQAYPNKPIRFLVGFVAGGTNDIVARALAQKLTENLAQSVVVENRGGANTAIATELGARAAPDGYTILLNAPGHATNPALMKLPYDSIKDFAFISLVAEAQNIVVIHPQFPPRNVKELIALSKRRPGAINFASSGTGTTVHLSAELFQYMTGIRWVHIPYKGGGPAAIELIAGQTQIMFANMPTAIQYVRDGRLRALAVTGARRASAAPELPTVAESGVPGYEVTAWYGVSAPAKTPRAIIDRLNGEIARALNSPDLKDRLTSQGADPIHQTPEQYTAFVQSEIAKWGKVIQAAGIKGE
ncbi:MAG: tripartite tricarboxylate transporter substrate binding protein [Betaproteobacteria bacterium]|nr:tripartite tricarboxylate transporter substrate binding protein [Betaproteobacteria bacterium]